VLEKGKFKTENVPTNLAYYFSLFLKIKIVTISSCSIFTKPKSKIHMGLYGFEKTLFSLS